MTVRHRRTLSSLVVLAVALQTPCSGARADDRPTVPPLYVHGNFLTAERGYLVFTTGSAVALRAGVTVPKAATIGSYVRVTLDQLGHDATLVEYEPKTMLPGEIDADSLPRQYLVVSERSRPVVATAVGASGPEAGLVTVTLTVDVPINTPDADDVYLSTDRSNYSPAEVRMQRAGARRFTISLSVAAGTILKYQYTRGSFATVERDRGGGIIPPHSLTITPNASANDTIVRWSDLS